MLVAAATLLAGLSSAVVDTSRTYPSHAPELPSTELLFGWSAVLLNPGSYPWHRLWRCVGALALSLRSALAAQPASLKARLRALLFTTMPRTGRHGRLTCCQRWWLCTFKQVLQDTGRLRFLKRLLGCAPLGSRAPETQPRPAALLFLEGASAHRAVL